MRMQLISFASLLTGWTTKLGLESMLDLLALNLMNECLLWVPMLRLGLVQALASLGSYLYNRASRFSTGTYTDWDSRQDGDVMLLEVTASGKCTCDLTAWQLRTARSCNTRCLSGYDQSCACFRSNTRLNILRHSAVCLGDPNGTHQHALL